MALQANSFKTTNKKSADRPMLLVGGGTGGHIFPLVAIGEELKTQKRPFIFVGSPKSKEEEVVTKLGWPFATVSAGKWRRYQNLNAFGQNLLDVGRGLGGIFQAIRLIKKTKASMIVSKGGFVALPVVVAASLTGRPIIIHESDAVMGLTNRISARFATKILTNFAISVFPNADSRFVQVGMPIRQALRQAAALKAPKKSRPLLLILPGSQGSQAINQYVAKMLKQLLIFTDVVHLTGEKDFQIFDRLRHDLSEKERRAYKAYRFIDRELPYYFQAADLIVARASATTVAEAALFRKPVFLIPLPTAASNHQLVNATILEKAGAAIVKEQHVLTPELFLRTVHQLMGNPTKLDQLGDSLHGYFNEEETINRFLKEMLNATR